MNCNLENMNTEKIKLFFGAGNLKSEKIVSDKYKFVWVGIPKSAMTSIINVLHENSSIGLETSVVCDDLKVILKKNKIYNNYFKFAFVRNPWSRVVSCYINKIQKGGIKDRFFLTNHVGLMQDISFDDFVYFITKKRGRFDFFSDRHWISQYRFISDRRGELIVDFVGKLENIDNDFRSVCKRLGIKNVDLPRYNTRNDWSKFNNIEYESSDYYRGFYTNKTKELVAKRYKKDIEMFGYNFK